MSTGTKRQERSSRTVLRQLNVANTQKFLHEEKPEREKGGLGQKGVKLVREKKSQVRRARGGKAYKPGRQGGPDLQGKRVNVEAINTLTDQGRSRKRTNDDGKIWYAFPKQGAT